MHLTDIERKDILAVCCRAIEAAARDEGEPELDLSAFSEKLRGNRSVFVTIRKHGELRGCVGSVNASKPLVEDALHSAYAAARYDQRVSQVSLKELSELELHVSILGALEPIQFTGEPDLLRQLQVGKDGLLIREGARTALFLPVMWSSLEEPKVFLEHLKEKAGLPRSYWSDSILAFRFAVVADIHGPYRAG